MSAELEQKLAEDANYADELIAQLSQHQQASKADLMRGLPPEQYKTTQALVKAFDAAIKIIKKTKTNTLSTSD
ncbi:EscE/YscE/SsaE family type III secretion system needle protein co-chaperone [Motilimonas pumila]|uniref:EscE/YscE/SsaE family type III secretion system needle protein co-chaperone n=1 Tax=Motilimonas pumila TaxID=2303987 RepID=A0A418YE00_9GAMM|nr:EscE/YscE/SsaE family type III secretion system needle protein co-chaperone [Motilimonas pumila]RJG42762.1 EscE/YscE/SsaE family type III secretion system needle protein co-chaperone [Motilimonas pumila]